MLKTPSRYLPTPRAMRGLTLIEIMVVIAIVGVLFRVALSSYQSNVLKTKRYAAQSCLMEYAQYMERYYTTNTSNPMTFTGASLTTTACSTSLASTYNFALNSAAHTYTITAGAKGTQLKDASLCITLTLSQDGTKYPSSCWP